MLLLYPDPAAAARARTALLLNGVAVSPVRGDEGGRYAFVATPDQKAVDVLTRLGLLGEVVELQAGE